MKDFLRTFSKTVRYRAPLFLLVTVLLAGLAGCAPKQMELSPVTSDPTNYHFPGRFVWCDLLSNDLPAAQTFYEGLFGWTFVQQKDYTIVMNQGQPIAGMVQVNSESKNDAYWISYLSVPDVKLAAEKVVQNKGAILKGPGMMLNRGEYVAITDPQGARLVLLHADGGDPDHVEPLAGDWLWYELWTSDTDSALSFYEDLVGYSTAPVTDMDQDRQDTESRDSYQVLTKDGHWCAGLTTIPFVEVPPQWVPAVRVDNIFPIIAKVEQLGGRILVKPSHPLSDGTVALIEDPAGAILMVEVWEPAAEISEDKEEVK